MCSTKSVYKQSKILSLTGALAVLICAALVRPHTAQAEVVWKLAPARSSIQFTVSHFVLMEVTGKFRASEAVVVTPSLEDFSNAKVQATIPISSIYTGNSDRDTHLKKEEFFFVDKYPAMVFQSTKVVKRKDGNYEMYGELTIRGVTRPITFQVEHVAHKLSNSGKARSKFKAVGKLNRYDYGLKWNDLTEAGAMVVGEEVEIEMDVALVQEGEQSTVAQLTTE